ncbi:hypothetical protein P7B02_04615 [Caulobacter segnis]|uniref:hypothetical protein n=1 Tax=Caulobacter segnis TaxID=88688 RepID=UPI00240F0DF2|nr:hypothetical protein [Caulobacter segnis]MDG2520818.1 hypothetical protein [Caulobacter segnis]
MIQAGRSIPISDVPGLITTAERQALTAITRELPTGSGRIVDGGSFLGASTVAILEGLPSESCERPPVIAIDRFTADDQYVLEELWKVPVDIRLGESFLPIFLKNLSGRAEKVEVRAGDLMRVGRVDEPISMAFIDLAKSPQTYSYILWQWVPKIVARSGVVFHQDWWTPMQPWLMAMTAPILHQFDVVADMIDESAVFRMKNVSEPIAAFAASWPRSPEEMTNRFNTVRRMFASRHEPLITLAEAHSLHLIGARTAAEGCFRACSPEGDHPKYKYWYALLDGIIGR